MAVFEVDFPDDLFSELLESDFEELAEDMLKEAAPTLEESLKKAAKSSILHDGESEAVESIKARKPKKSKKGDAYFVFAGPSGYSKTKTYHHTRTGREYKVSNALKLVWKEYGIAHPHHHQPARPFLAKAKNDAQGKCIEKMQEIYNKKVGAE